MPITVTNDTVASSVIEKFGAAVAPLNSFSTNFANEPAAIGATVTVGLVDVMSSGQLFNGSSYVTNSESNIAPVVVPLQYYHKTFHIQDSDASVSSVAKLSNLVGTAAKAFGKTLFALAVGPIVTGAAGFGATTVGVSATGFDLSKVKTLRTALDMAGADSDNRSLVLNADYYTNLIPVNSTTLTPTAAADGKVPNAMGFDVYSVNYPSNSQNVVGFAAHPSALAIAARVPVCQNPDKLDAYQVIEIPGLGIPVGYRQFTNVLDGKSYGQLEAMFGAKAANLSGCKIITQNP